MRHARKAAEGGFHRGAGETQFQAHGRRQKQVLAVMGSGHGQGAGIEQGAGGGHHLVAFDPEQGIEARRQGAAIAGGDPLGPWPAGRLGAQVGVIGIEDLAGAALQQAALDRPVMLQAAVAL